MSDKGDERSIPQAGKKKPRGKFVLVRDTEDEEEKVEAAKALLPERALLKIDTIEGIAARGIEVISASKGRLLCRFKIPNFMADENGDWRVGAMAAVMNNVCVTTGVSSLGEIRATVIFDISCFSPAKVEEEVEIEGNVLQEKESLGFVEVKIRKKRNGEMVATGREWMSSSRDSSNSANCDLMSLSSNSF